MSERLTKTYGLQGEPETRIEREMDHLGNVNFIEPQNDSCVPWIPKRITLMEG